MTDLTNIIILVILILGTINVFLYKYVIYKKTKQISNYINRGALYDVAFLTIWFGFGFLIIPYILFRFLIKYVRELLKKISKFLIKYL